MQAQQSHHGPVPPAVERASRGGPPRPPKEFDNRREAAPAMGFVRVASGPFARSSYHARQMFQPIRSGDRCLAADSKP